MTGSEKKVSLTLEQVRTIYQAGIRRGSDEATAFDWGSSPSGKVDDELEAAIHDIANEGLSWGNPDYINYDSLEAMFGQLAHRTTTPN